MDRERVLREMQRSVTSFDGGTSDKGKENSPPIECARYKQAYYGCVQRSSGLLETIEGQRVLVSKLSTFQSLKVSL